jgi:class 3 adenylate cyclase
MASFSKPIDAVRAAIDMTGVLDGATSEPLHLKIGIHRGPCLVVNVRDQVDYFGQTVNIAARVQATAKGGELCITDAVRQDENVVARLAQYGEIAPEQVMLRGVDTPQSIFRYQIG